MADSHNPVQIPSTAVMATLVVGLILIWLGLMQCTVEFVTRQMDLRNTVADVADSVAFGLGFLALAWILWVKPWVGGILLTISGIAIGVWISNDWGNPKNTIDLVVRTIFSFAPIAMGVFTFAQEFNKK